jgi:hypothetical protein
LLAVTYAVVYAPATDVCSSYLYLKADPVIDMLLSRMSDTKQSHLLAQGTSTCTQQQSARQQQLLTAQTRCFHPQQTQIRSFWPTWSFWLLFVLGWVAMPFWWVAAAAGFTAGQGKQLRQPCAGMSASHRAAWRCSTVMSAMGGLAVILGCAAHFAGLTHHSGENQEQIIRTHATCSSLENEEHQTPLASLINHRADLQCDVVTSQDVSLTA